MLSFQCEIDADDEDVIATEWVGKILRSYEQNGAIELHVEGCGSEFIAVIGPCTSGWYACIPTYGAGCNMGPYDDYFFNLGNLARVLSRPDAVTLAKAIATYAESVKKSS